jgi:aspartyl-tRNA(Asn)/glutamyl-tRNA(Gln) amidotransferase subunit A
MTTTDTAANSISEAADLVRKRKLSPIELTQACLERIAALDGRVRAFITVTREDALASAQQATSAISRGNYKGPLHGIPIALKDLFDTAGVRTPPVQDPASACPQDGRLMARLRAAGAILLGNTHGRPAPRA